ncbi:chemotaxis protein CheW [Gloeomargaritales cyanobacterium VI4D9]|nr:chemotaxis protein CheW [Gloeomargaritales cyanobacterium VI4D9]
MTRTPVAVPPQECFAVRLGKNVRLALPAEVVREVAQISPPEICPLPGVPAALLGVVNRAGQLCWVLDLGAFLHIPGATPSEHLPLTTVVVTTGNHRLALVVTALEGLFTADQSQLVPMPPQLHAWYRELFQGLVYRQREALALLLPTAVLARLAQGDTPN